LVEIFRMLHEVNPDYRLLMLGDGVLREAVEQRIAEYGLQDVCVLTGARNDAWRFYNALDVFALPSSWEGLGISFVEAQVNGLPTFASTAVPRETKISGLIEYLPTGDKNASLWAKRILACGGRDGRKDDGIIDNKFDIRVHARALEEEYKKLTEAHGR